MDSESSRPPGKKSWLARAGHALLAASEKQGTWSFITRVLSSLTFWCSLLYCLGLIALSLLMSRVGERYTLTTILIFLPPLIYLLPGVCLAVLGLLFNRKAMLLNLAMIGWVSYSSLGWRMGKAAAVPAEAETLTVMTNNHGQHKNQSLRPFINATQPDVIILQETPGRARHYAEIPDYTKYIHVQSVGEHTLLSKFPIVEGTLLPSLPGQKNPKPRAVRFVVDWKGRQIAVYSVHLNSPQETVRQLAAGGFIYGIIGVPGTRWAETRKSMQVFWDNQIADAELILKAVRAETLPCIVGGDFNSPNTGYVYRLIRQDLEDSHAQAGSGFGWSCPADTKNPITRGEPWLRIDYLFHDDHWQSTHSVTEKERHAQHRAMTSTLMFKGA